MAEIGMHEAKTTLSKLVERALDGEEIVLTNHGEPVVRLEPIKRSNRMADIRGALRGQIRMADDFDDLPDDFMDFFGGQ